MATRLQQKEVRFSGFSTLPDDYLCKDGGVAFATGSVFEDGGLRSIPDPERLGLVVGEGAAVHIHHTTNYYHYLVVYQERDEDGEPTSVRVYVVDRENMEGEEKPIMALDQDKGNSPIVEKLYECAGEFLSLSCIGNTLIISTSEDMYYFLCKPGGYEGETLTEECSHPYIFLGNKVPSVDMEFGLDLECKMKTYMGTGVEKTKFAEGGSDDINTQINSARNLSGVSFLMEGTDSGKSVTYNMPFGGEFTLEANHGYILRIGADADDAAGVDRIVLVGMRTDGDGTEQETILDTGTGVHTFTNFTVQHDYSVVAITIIGGSMYTNMGTVYIDEVSSCTSAYYFIAATQENFEAVMGCINKFIADFGTSKNRFIHPFFVRYAVRLYDESVCELSVPILMVPNSGYVPFVYCNEYPQSMGDNDEVEDPKEWDALNLYAYVGELRYRLLSNIDPDWKDVIQGVDIYVSAPIYPYDQGKEFSQFDNDFVYKDIMLDKGVNEVSDLSFGIGRLANPLNAMIYDPFLNYGPKYRLRRLADDAGTFFGFGNTALRWRLTQVAAKETEDIDQEIKDNANFYLVKRINLDEMEATEDFQELRMDYDTLTGLVAREALSEDVVPYAGIKGGQLYTYNNRLHIFGGETVLRDFTNPACQVQHDDWDEGYDSLATAYVYVRTDDGTKIVKTTYDMAPFYTAGFIWLFYPHNRAFKVLLDFGDGDGSIRLEIPLSEHNFLNGACFFLRTAYGLRYAEDLDPDMEQYLYDGDLPSDDDIDDTLPSTSIYVSEVDNPFVFLNSTAVTAGSGKVLALSTAAQAMSQGQFGQYPLYAFTDEGVWALSVADTGVYGTSHPITRDVVTNVGSITQLDSSVLFVTDRGIMQIAGSATACITEGIDGEYGQFDLESLPSFARVYMALLGMEESEDGDDDAESVEDTVKALVSAWTKTRFFDYIRTCGMVYDYTHQRVIVYNANSPIAYNYSLKDKQWCMMFSDIRATVLSYPDALVLEEMTDAQKEAYGLGDTEETLWELVDLSTYAKKYKVDEDTGEETEDDSLEASLFVTRPMKLDAPDIEKTLDSLVLRGYFQQSMRENHITGMVLYGSPDLFNWFVVGQAATREIRDGLLSLGHEIRNVQGRPYKYFRLVVGCKLDRRECVSGVSILYEPRDNNVLR